MEDLFGGITATSREGSMHEVALGVVYCTRRQRILMLERDDLAGGIRWVFPGGKIDPQDSRLRFKRSAVCAAVREVYEETGLRLDMRGVKWLACRRHPITKTYVHYVYVALAAEGELNREPLKHLRLDWWAPGEILSSLGDRLAPEVWKHLRRLADVPTQAAPATANDSDRVLFPSL